MQPYCDSKSLRVQWIGFSGENGIQSHSLLELPSPFLSVMQLHTGGGMVD